MSPYKSVYRLGFGLALGYFLPAIAAQGNGSSSAAAATLAALENRPPSFATIAKRTMPIVVNISTTAQRAPRGGSGDPIDEFFNRFFGESQPRDTSQRSLGSGILISKDGEILTSYHVVKNADAIKVKLADQSEYEARLVGKDDRTDLALIKIRKTNVPLPFARLGTSSQLDVGDWVMAIGNPFGLEHTVTAGIVSAKGRVIGAGPYDNFIQTDASINPGNSGGPLINAVGEVVGVNSAIFSQSGGNVGIGFAIPIDLAKKIADQLRKNGKVVRGWMGVAAQSRSAVDLSVVYQDLRQVDQGADWYLHPNRRLLLCGNRRAQGGDEKGNRKSLCHKSNQAGRSIIGGFARGCADQHRFYDVVTARNRACAPEPRRAKAGLRAGASRAKAGPYTARYGTRCGRRTGRPPQSKPGWMAALRLSRLEPDRGTPGRTDRRRAHDDAAVVLPDSGARGATRSRPRD